MVAASLQTFCTLNALTVKAPEGAPRSFTLSSAATGNTPVNCRLWPRESPPGTDRNAWQSHTSMSWGQFFLDANIQKSFQITESKALSIRVDATNILNHPQLATPNFAVGDTPPSGQIVDPREAGSTVVAPVQRNFQGQLRLTF